MPECQCRTEAADTGSNDDAGLTFSGIPAFLYNFSTSYNLSARITPSAVVYGRAGCIFFYCLQFGRAVGGSLRDYHQHQQCSAGSIPFHRQQYGRACLVYPFPPPCSSMDVQGVCISFLKYWNAGLSAIRSVRFRKV
jgi:hypothetical protein